MEQVRPCWLIVVGPAAAGKSTIARRLIEDLPLFRLVSDLEALQQLFALNEQRKAPWGLKEEAFSYWDDNLRLSEMKGTTQRVPGGGHDILDPKVWDEALRRTIRRHRERPHLVLEFARGIDVSYQSLHGIGSHDAYRPSFSVLADELAGGIVTSFVVIHVTAPLAIRLTRNAARRSRGEHSVADSVMRSIYESDPFNEVGVTPLRNHDFEVTVIGADTSPGNEKVVDTVVASVVCLVQSIIG